MQSSGLIREGFVFNYDISFVGLSVSWYSFQFNLSVHSNSITGINTGLFFFFFFLVVPCILILSKSLFVFTNECTIFLLRSTLKFALKFTLIHYPKSPRRRI